MKATRSYTQGARADAALATRERIVEAAAALFLAEPHEDVTLVRIAKAASVSHQTVLNHFQSKDGVILAVAKVVGAETTSIRYAVAPGDVPGAIRALVEDYERLGDANFRWAATATGAIAGVLDDARAGHQAWLTEMFGERLPKATAKAAPARARAIHALHAATDVYTWKLLRRDLGLSRAETETTIADLVVGILGGTDR